MSLPVISQPKDLLISVLQSKLNSLGFATGMTPQVISAYPKNIEDFKTRPVITVRETSSRELKRFIGGVINDTYTESNETWTSEHGYIEEANFEIIIFTLNADFRDKLSHIIRYIFNLESTQDALTTSQILWCRIQSSGDDEFNENDGAWTIFTKQFTAVIQYFVTEAQILQSIQEINVEVDIIDKLEIAQLNI